MVNKSVCDNYVCQYLKLLVVWLMRNEVDTKRLLTVPLVPPFSTPWSSTRVIQ